MPFKKGNKLGGGPGRPNKDIDVQALARKYTQAAIKALADIVQDEEATAASRVSAAEAILSRGWGKPIQPIQGADGGPIEIRWLSGPAIAPKS